MSSRKRSQPYKNSSMSSCSCSYEESDYKLLGKTSLGVITKRQKIDIARPFQSLMAINFRNINSRGATDKDKVDEAWEKAEEVDLDDMLSQVLRKPVETESQAYEVGIANS